MSSGCSSNSNKPTVFGAHLIMLAFSHDFQLRVRCLQPLHQHVPPSTLPASTASMKRCAHLLSMRQVSYFTLNVVLTLSQPSDGRVISPHLDDSRARAFRLQISKLNISKDLTRNILMKLPIGKASASLSYLIFNVDTLNSLSAYSSTKGRLTLSRAGEGDTTKVLEELERVRHGIQVIPCPFLPPSQFALPSLSLLLFLSKMLRLPCTCAVFAALWQK